MHKNALKGNAAEYLVLHYLLKAGIPAWQTGGNNRKWDLIIQTAPDRLALASVKYAKTRLPILNKGDEAQSEGLYFIVVPIKKSEDWEVLLFDSKTISKACIHYKKKSKHQKSFLKRPNFRNFRITEAEYQRGKSAFEAFLAQSKMNPGSQP